MRNLYIIKFVFLCFIVFISNSTLFSCNLSDYTLTSVTGTGPYTIVTRLCVGGGLTGAVRGGDNGTSTISFGLYSADSTFTTLSWSPINITGSGTGCTSNTSFVISSLGAPYNSNRQLFYTGPASCGTRTFTCVYSTAQCGAVSQQCINITFVTNVMPDSIRSFGVEGAGNQIAGCTYNPDMLINFNPSLPVFWSTVDAKKINNNEVAVNWTTLSEVSNYFFTIEKTNDLVEAQNHHGQQEDLSVWTQCGIINGTNKNAPANYSFIDKNPFPEQSYYRIKQTDFSGKFSYSKIAMVNAAIENDNVKIYPNPSKNILNVEYGSLKSMSLLNMLGEKVYEESNADDIIVHAINTQNIPEGIYLLKIIRLNNEVASYKIKITH
ncbi:MAG TPA: T9SS type A sorting domain-containing protein [Chitinophagales bacterium]|nr:T9SS type A sorting domain-containing protein [Chitinophagales bacterium]